MYYIPQRCYFSRNFASAIGFLRQLAGASGHQILAPAVCSLVLEAVVPVFITWLTLGGAGLRQSEVCGTRGRVQGRLKWEDFDWDNKHIIIRLGTSRNR